MCDMSTSIIFWALSPIPGFRYVGPGLVVTSFIIYAANRQSPSYKLNQLEDMIKMAEDILKGAREKCARDHVELTNEARRLLE
jgi:urease gamma subunit